MIPLSLTIPPELRTASRMYRRKYIKDTIQQNRVAVLEYKRRTTGETMRLFITPSTLYSETAHELVFSFQGGGCYVWDGQKVLGVFDLVAFGFPLYIARDVALLILNLFQKQTAPIPAQIVPHHGATAPQPKRKRK